MNQSQDAFPRYWGMLVGMLLLDRCQVPRHLGEAAAKDEAFEGLAALEAAEDLAEGGAQDLGSRGSRTARICATEGTRSMP